ncbi:MAG TPA: Xaa-Pro aminopeptidase [Candidatus Limnocylindrales bacterium]|nr:Xaa-Pro aminopeptidase [Candidatus Limnocylindrales bacterium]
MKGFFSSEFFMGNRQRLLGTVQAGLPIVLTAHGQLQRSSDGIFPFQQDSSFWYLTGIEYPDVIVVVDGTEGYAIVPERSASREAFDGVVDFDELKAISGLAEVMPAEAGWERLTRRLKQTKKYATLLPNPPYIEGHGVYSNPARAALGDTLKSLVPNLKVHDIRMDVARLRMIKQAPELQALRQAIDITIDTLLEVAQPDVLARYQAEYEVDADIGRGFRFRGARGHAFDPIVASGKNATILHNVSNTVPLKKGDLLVLDVGAEYQHYAADVTRTVAYGEPSRRQQAVQTAVLAVQEHAIALVKPGILLKEYEQQVEKLMGEQLLKLGLIKEATKESIRRYYPHATSHFLGLDAHDAGDYSQPLPVGAVITVEPGIYIPEEGIGVRIEDDVLITETGCDVLSGRLSKALKLG